MILHLFVSLHEILAAPHCEVMRELLLLGVLVQGIHIILVLLRGRILVRQHTAHRTDDITVHAPAKYEAYHGDETLEGRGGIPEGREGGKRGGGYEEMRRRRRGIVI